MERIYSAPLPGETVQRRAAYVRRLQATNFVTDDLTELRQEQRAVDPDEFLWNRFAPANLEQIANSNLAHHT